MKTIGVLIGTNDEPVSNKYYKLNKHKLKFLKEYDIHGDHIPYDFAIFAEIKYLGNSKNINVIPLFGQNLTLKECNTCDCIFSIFEGVYAFMNGGIDLYRKNMSILKRTNAQVFPSHKLQEFIIKKHKYMTYLQKKGYTIPLTKFIDLSKVNLVMLDKFIVKNDLNTIIFKPELGAFKEGVKIIKNPTSKKIKTQLDIYKKKKYNRLLLQPFIEEFNKFGEIKTYWINGSNIFSYKQQWKGGDGVFSHQNKIDKKLLAECLKIGKDILEDISKDYEDLIQCRIDFACCINNDNRCREFFVNEIEICPTIGSSDYELYGSYYKTIAETVINYCK